MEEINIRSNYFMLDPQNWDDNPILCEVIVKKDETNYYNYVLWTLSGGLDFRLFKVPMYDFLSAGSANESIEQATEMLSCSFEIDKDAQPALYKRLMKYCTEKALPVITQIAKENELIEEDDEIETLL